MRKAEPGTWNKEPGNAKGGTWKSKRRNREPGTRNPEKQKAEPGTRNLEKPTAEPGTWNLEPGTGNGEERSQELVDKMAESQGKSYGGSAFGFEDLNVYKAARQFRRRMYQIAKVLPSDERFALIQQMRRAAISLTNNLAEGYGRYTWQDRTHFCRQARGSLMELVDDIGACHEEGYIAEAELKSIREQAAQVLQLMNGYIGYLQKGLKEKG